MTSRPDDPFVIPADELGPATATPADAPPPPDELPQGEAMQQVTRLAARRKRGGALWPVAGSLLTLIVSVAAYDYLRSLLARYPALGLVALALTALLVLLILAQLVREAWAFRRLARIDLWEISIVTFPLLPEARVAHVKSDADHRLLDAISNAARRMRASLSPRHSSLAARANSAGRKMG